MTEVYGFGVRLSTILSTVKRYMLHNRFSLLHNSQL